MPHLAYRPGPPFNEFVDCFWLIADGQAPRRELILPSGTIELVVNLRDDEVRIYDRLQHECYRRFSGAVLSGTYSTPFACDAMQHESMFGVHFKPDGAFPFLGTAAMDLKDTHADLVDHWGRPAHEFRERVCGAPTPQERCRAAEELLCERLRYFRKRHPAVRFALNMFGPAGNGASIREAAREVGLCQRRFIEVFNAEVGLKPKIFCRLLRFQRARIVAHEIHTQGVSSAEQDRARLFTNSAHNGRRGGTSEVYEDAATSCALKLDWARVATSCGYFDQSHLINDFEQFSGLSPTEYIRRQMPDDFLKDNHVPVSD